MADQELDTNATRSVQITHRREDTIEKPVTTKSILDTCVSGLLAAINLVTGTTSPSETSDSQPEIKPQCYICANNKPIMVIWHVDLCGHPCCGKYLGGYVHAKLEKSRDLPSDDRRSTYLMPCPMCDIAGGTFADSGVISRTCVQKLNLSAGEKDLYTQLELSNFAATETCPA